MSLTYDALGRMVEQNRSGTYTESVYGPDGRKLALMNGQTVQKAFVPLPGKAVAVYNSTGLDHYRHRDWLGGSRFASTPSRGMYFDVAYAPFGEPYAQSGTTDLSFTGQNQDTVGGGLTGLYDFPAREYSTQGRWPSPDPAGLGAVLPENPQTWNRYAYVLNNPLNLIDPLGRDCAYLSDNGDTIESIDLNSDFSECSANGGFWADGTIIGIGFNPNSDNVNLLSWQIDGNGNIQFGWTQAGTLTGTGTSGTWSSITQWAASGADVPLNSFAAAVFAQVYQQSKAVADPQFIALWYGAPITLAVGVLYGPAAVIAGLNWFYANPLTVYAAVDFARGAIAPGYTPLTPIGILGAQMRTLYNNLNGRH